MVLPDARKSKLETAQVPNIELPEGISRISPSRYFNAQSCRLREVLIANKTALQLPHSPAAAIGTVTHQLIEMASRGLVDRTDRIALGAEWDNLLEKEEKTLSGSWLSRLVLPLRDSTRNFDVRRLQAISRCIDLGQPGTSKKLSGSTVGVGPEIWVEDIDGIVGGKIDLALRSSDEILLRDYKTGALFDSESDNETPIIREGYAVQMKLYAALYVEKFGEWPTRLELVGPKGETKNVEFEKAECEELLVDVRGFHSSINGVLKDEKSDREKVSILACAQPEFCKFCPYRPSCNPYKEASPDWERGYFCDSIGLVESLKQLGNGKLLLSLGTRSGSVRIKGIKNQVQRHPALQTLQVGDVAEFYNVVSGRSAETISEGKLTVIYTSPGN